MNISKKIEKQLIDFCHQNKIDLLTIFGSFVNRKRNSYSDIDIAILSKTNLNKLKLIVQLEVIFQQEVDVVILTEDTDPLLRYEIFFSGKNLFESAKGLFDEEKLKAWKLYVDTQKIRELRKQFIKKYVRKLKSDIGSTP